MKDARWEYTWDVNNRLVEIHEYPMLTMAVNAGLDGHYPLRRIRFAYDYLGRRIAKTVWVYVPWQGSAWSGWRLEKDLRYVYDGWQMIAELDHTFAPATAGWQPTRTWSSSELSLPEQRQAAQMGYGGFTGISGVAAERSVVRTYLWGQDLSGTMTGAGGVGGLISLTHQGITYHTCSDANGNITGLLAANGLDAGQLIARFDYDPFGNRITNTGPDVEICPMGFSSKYTDSETGLVDYGLRIYSPMMARFLSRDPMYEITGEHPELMEEGPNLYGFVRNDPVNGYDFRGLKWKKASKSEQPKDETRVVWKRDSKEDTLEKLAELVKLDPKEKDKWAKSVGTGYSCSVSVPNVFIVANLMGYDSVADAVISTFGGKLGSMFTFDGSRKRVSVSSAEGLHSAISKHNGNLWALALYAHGGDNTDNSVHATREGPRISSSRTITSMLKSNGFQLSKIWAMQCFSGANGWDSVWDTLSYQKAVYYYGVNAGGIIDTGKKPKK